MKTLMVIVALVLSVSPAWAHDTNSANQTKTFSLQMCVTYPYENFKSAADKEAEFRTKYGAEDRRLDVSIDSGLGFNTINTLSLSRPYQYVPSP